MSEPTKAELALTVAKAECFKVCGSMGDVAHELHREALERAYAAFQAESGTPSPSNLASGDTSLEAHLVVDSGVA